MNEQMIGVKVDKCLFNNEVCSEVVGNIGVSTNAINNW